MIVDITIRCTVGDEHAGDLRNVLQNHPWMTLLNASGMSIIILDIAPQSNPEPLPMPLKVDDMRFSVRTRKALHRNNIVTLAELVQHSGDDLLEFKNFGMTSLNEVTNLLWQLGLTLKKPQKATQPVL